jgi:putative ABC transport system permease protein
MSGPATLAAQLRLVLRQVTRNRRRATLTFVGLVISFFLFTSLESMLYTLESLVEQEASATGIFLRPRSRASFFSARLPMRYVDHVRSIEGVTEASPVRFHFAQGRRDGSFAVALGVEPESYLRLRQLDGVTHEEARAFRADRRTALVGRRMLDANGWEVGDEVTLRGNGRMPSLSVRVVGDVANADRMSRAAFVHIDYLADVVGGRGRAAFIQARISHPSLGPAIVAAIDERFKHFVVPTRTQTERAHVSGMVSSLSDVLDALRAIGYVTLAITVLVVGNSVSMSVRERTVEIGTLRALGFGRRRVMSLVLGESMLLSLLGGATGALIAYVGFELEWIRLPRGVGMPLTSDESVLLRASLLALPVGLLAGLQPAWSAVRMSITDALRWAD